MSINKENDVYLKNGRLDLSVLNEEQAKTLRDQKDHHSILEEIELIQVNDENISETLEQMAMMFEQEDEKKEFQK